MSSHTQIVAEIIYEVLAETARTYENAESAANEAPNREDYVSDVVQQLQTQLDSGFWREAGEPEFRNGNRLMEPGSGVYLDANGEVAE